MKLCTYFIVLFSMRIFAFSLSEKEHNNIYSYNRPLPKEITTTNLVFDPALKPFYHGVASGDPLQNQVILWTRITPDTDGPIEVKWYMSKDPKCTSILLSGSIITDQSKDYTIKIDAGPLEAGTVYYYKFSGLGRESVIGRTKTAPSKTMEALRFGIASCANYQQGYFNSYAAMSARNDLDAILFLGDYIYEYADGGYGYSKTVNRGHEPKNETVTLSDYRIRYSFYRLDPDLRRLHQLHPFIGIWDDHETANDSWPGGAENHNPLTEGDWQTRKYAGEKAYFEWLPIREQSVQGKIYRTINYGGLCDIFMIDTRLEGRDKPLGAKDTTSSAIDTVLWNSPNRTILGNNQFEWLTQSLKSSKSQWKIIANQVMMMPLAGFTNLDSWDGYPAEREKLLRYLKNNSINNTLVVTGDIHCTWASDLPVLPRDTSYKPLTGEGSVACEFVTPSITSANINELQGIPPNTPQSKAIAGQLKFINPHIKEIDLDNHGYMVLDLQSDKAQADWYFVDSTTTRNKGEYFYKGYYTPSGKNAIKPAISNMPTLSGGPANPDELPLQIKESSSEHLLGIGNYPNPFINNTLIHYAVSKFAVLSLIVYDILGNEVLKGFMNVEHQPGPYVFELNALHLPSGTYSYKISSENQIITKSMNIVK
jgi:alkaline phosphatase D